ncbi:MAG: AAA family ATPase [Proteobacteria bacterium]|nr:AAA family ATPase [Pseudomonadota bacterium]
MRTYYNKFFNLEKDPFGETPDPDFFCAIPQHSRALQELTAAIHQGRGFSLLTGEVGTGKTLLARMLLTAIGDTANTALILFPRFTDQELLEAICEEFEVPLEGAAPSSTKAWVDHLNRFLLKSEAVARRSILVIDEAQALTPESLEMIRLLTNLETRNRKLLQIVLVGQPELCAILERNELRQLKQRVGAHANLEPLDATETGKYVRSRIERAVNGNFIKFEDSSIRVIHELSSGMPRRINQVCGRIITYAAEVRARRVDGALVKEALGMRPRGLMAWFQRSGT